MPAVKRVIPSEDIMPNVLKVLDLIAMSIRPIHKKNMKPYHDAYSISAVGGNQPKVVKSVGKQCVDLMNKSLYSHRYEEAAKLLWILCEDRSVFEMFIFKASMLIIDNFKCCNKSEFMLKFLREIQNLELVNKKEVQLEYIIHSLYHNIEKAKENSEELIDRKRKKYLRKNRTLDPVFEAYCICLEHINMEFFPADTQQSQSERTVDAAILKLASLVETPGDWDIFVLKLINFIQNRPKEEKKEKKDDQTISVKDVLLKYAESNPLNLNAHIYLCAYLNEFDTDSEKLIEHLNIISQMSPSDERVLMLLEKLQGSDENLKKCIKLNFMFLDYPSNGKNLKAWRMLSDFLHRSVRRQNKSALKTLQTCWVSRCKSWQRMYYNPSQVVHITDSESELVAHKVQVLSYFDLDHAYVTEVTQKFPTILDLLKVPYDEPRTFSDEEMEATDDT